MDGFTGSWLVLMLRPSLVDQTGLIEVVPVCPPERRRPRAGCVEAPWRRNKMLNKLEPFYSLF